MSISPMHWKSALEKRSPANDFDRSHVPSEAEIGALVRFATTAPSAFNLQNWRFVAARGVRRSLEEIRLMLLAVGRTAESNRPLKQPLPAAKVMALI